MWQHDDQVDLPACESSFTSNSFSAAYSSPMTIPTQTPRTRAANETLEEFYEILI